MAYHEFDLIRNSVTYRLRVKDPEFRMEWYNPDTENVEGAIFVPYEVETTDWDGTTIWEPVHNVKPNISLIFPQAEFVQACSDVGSTTVANAADYQNYTNDVCEQLALNRWGD